MTKMKLSLIVRGQHPPGDPAGHLADDLDLVRAADRLGFDGVVKGSHFSAHPFQSVQQIPFLSYCAAIAPRLRIICGLVLVPLHKPLELAEALATLDLMSGGRLVFGAGIGYRDVEFKAFGVPRGRMGERFEETIEAIKRLWTEEFVDMKGSHFELDHATCPVKPVQQPMPPIWIGANADIAIERAARIGDCWYINPHNTLATIGRQMDLYKRALDAAGKPFPNEVPMRREVFVAKSRAEAIRLAQPYLEEKYRAYRAWGQDKVMPEGDDFDHEFNELLEDRFLLGSPREVADQLNRLNTRLGVNHLVASIHWPGMPNSLALEQLQILSEEVRPLLA
ncbi:MAG TPA: LLM class flavin-dependent oxidoreductase [Stellaceae bacterium]|jgi:alkanesulfonate monooxygenase SsuD/methylene tetrahydromethanopterin reductase-like flavin-dependent oxidoreductase (luciferase family)|nr:LLM class flavin-dependent oxidoreductase [Stellaceae bacterium]